jgi:tetratricopeptide (TPR) repeat protein
MAPEVHLGELADARADQYSLCVALYEALVGRPPFTGHGEAELMQRKLGGAPEVPRTIPRRLRQTIARGLSPASADRFDSMDALVHALQQAGASRRRTTVLAFTVMAVASLWWFAREPEPSPCQRAQQRWQGIWDAATQQTVRSALLATEVPYAPEIVTEVEAGLDRYREQWVRIYTEACEATLVRGEQSQALFEVRSLCLEQRLGEARAVVALLQQADQTVVERSASAVAGLRPLERCGSGAALLTQMEPPSEPSAMEPIREQLAEVAALEWAGKYDEGLARAESVISAAEASEYAPALAEAYLRKGRMLERRGDYDEAVTWLSEAHWLAEGHRHEEVAAEAAALLVFVIGAVQGKFDEAVAWGRHAEASVRRVGLGGREEAELLNNLGTTHTARGEYKAGLDLFQRALVLKRAVWGADHHQVAIQLGNVGIALEELQRYDEAEAAYRESLSLTENTLGARHPQAAIAVGNLAGLAQVRGEFERAHSLFARALAIKQETLAPHHASLGYTYDGLGMAARNLGRFADAVLHHQRAVAIFTAALGPDHPGVATSLNNLGSALRRLGQLDEAHEAFERARRIWTARMGGEHRYNAVALTNLGLVAEARGDLSEALRYHQEARTIERAQDNPDPTHQAQLAVNLGRLLHQRGNDARAAELYAEALGVLESTWPEGHPEIASVLDAQGELALAQGRIEPALHILERAFEIREDHPDAPLEWGNTAFIYAKALEHAGDAEAAHRLATRTLARMEQTQVGPAELREIRQWLDARK